MDFNTEGSGGRPDDESRPLYGGEAGGRPTGEPPRGPVGDTTVEFNLQDPVGSFISTVQNIVLNPVGFFRGIAKRGDFVNPLVFALICAVINGILGGIIGFFISLAFASGNQGFGGALGGLLGNIILSPIYAVIALFIGAGIYHLLVMLLVRPTNAGFEATFRIVSYASVTWLISWIPLVGWIVAPIYGIVLSILGIREVHATTTGKAALVVLIPVVIVLVLLAIFAAVLGALFVTLMQQSSP
jgi:hypothetical protein